MFVLAAVKKLAQNIGRSNSGLGNTAKSKTCSNTLYQINLEKIDELHKAVKLKKKKTITSTTFSLQYHKITKILEELCLYFTKDLMSHNNS